MAVKVKHFCTVSTAAFLFKELIPAVRHVFLQFANIFNMSETQNVWQKRELVLYFEIRTINV